MKAHDRLALLSLSEVSGSLFIVVVGTAISQKGLQGSLCRQKNNNNNKQQTTMMKEVESELADVVRFSSIKSSVKRISFSISSSNCFSMAMLRNHFRAHIHFSPMN